MKLINLLHYIAHDVNVTIAQVNSQGDYMTVYNGKKEDLMDYLLDVTECNSDNNYINRVHVVSIDTSMFYSDLYDMSDAGEPVIVIVVVGWRDKENV